MPRSEIYKCCVCDKKFYELIHIEKDKKYSRLLYSRSSFSGSAVPITDLPDITGLYLTDALWDIRNGLPIGDLRRLYCGSSGDILPVECWRSKYGFFCSFTCQSQIVERDFRDFGPDRANEFLKASIEILDLQNPANMESKWGKVIVKLLEEFNLLKKYYSLDPEVTGL